MGGLHHHHDLYYYYKLRKRWCLHWTKRYANIISSSELPNEVLLASSFDRRGLEDTERLSNLLKVIQPGSIRAGTWTQVCQIHQFSTILHPGRRRILNMYSLHWGLDCCKSYWEVVEFVSGNIQSYQWLAISYQGFLMSFDNLASDRKMGTKDWRLKKMVGIEFQLLMSLNLEFTNSESNHWLYVSTGNFLDWDSDMWLAS